MMNLHQKAIATYLAEDVAQHAPTAQHRSIAPDVSHEEESEDELVAIANNLYESKNGKEIWMKTPYAATGRQPTQNVMKEVPGPTTYAKGFGKTS